MWLFVQYVCIAFLWQSRYNPCTAEFTFPRHFAPGLHRRQSAPCMQLNDCFAQWPHRAKTIAIIETLVTQKCNAMLCDYLYDCLVFIIVRQACRSVTLLIYWHYTSFDAKSLSLWLPAGPVLQVLDTQVVVLVLVLELQYPGSSPGLCDLKR